MEYLDYYLQAYVTATKRAREKHYIDAFASCGECTIIENGLKIEGSARRALNTVPRFTGYHFVERRPRYAAHLREAILSMGIANATVHVGDCNDVLLARVLPVLPTDVPSFAFLDPYGLQLDWVTVQKLAGHRRPLKMELLILYPYDMAVVRVFANWEKDPNARESLTRFYGSEVWLQELEHSIADGEGPDKRRDRFLALYVCNLQGLGYRYVHTFGPMCSSRGPLYHVIFAGDHSVGATIMKDVWAKTRYVPGELGYQPVRRPKSRT